jgi:hypothetical protein
VCQSAMDATMSATEEPLPELAPAAAQRSLGAGPSASPAGSVSVPSAPIAAGTAGSPSGVQPEARASGSGSGDGNSYTGALGLALMTRHMCRWHGIGGAGSGPREAVAAVVPDRLSNALAASCMAVGYDGRAALLSIVRSFCFVVGVCDVTTHT